MQLHEKHLNFSESEKHEKRKMTRASPWTFKWEWFTRLKFLKSFCNFLILHCCQDCLKMKKAGRKGYQSVIQMLWVTDYENSPLFEVKSFHPHPRSHASYIWKLIIVAHITTVSQNGIWHVYFLFTLKYLCNPLLHISSICSNLIYLFQSSNETGCSVGLRQINEKYIRT